MCVCVRFSPVCGKNVVLKNDNCMAVRTRHYNHGLIFSSAPLEPDQVFEVRLSHIVTECELQLVSLCR